MFDATEARPTDPVAAITTGITNLAAEDRDHWTGATLSDRLIELLEVRERLDAHITQLTGQWNKTRAWETNGALSPTAWLAYRSPIGRSKANRLVHPATMTTDHPELGDALAAGEVTTTRIEVLTKVATPRRRHLVGEHLDTLLGAAAVLSVDDFTTTARRWAVLADDQVTNSDTVLQHERRGPHVSTTLGGMVLLDGTLPATEGATVIAALDNLAPPDAADVPDGPRSLSQRRHDALVDLATAHLKGNKPSGTATTINVVVDTDTLTGRDNGLVAARCDLDRVGPIGRDTITRLGCDGAFSRILMDGPSVILDMGRRTRLATTSQRRALAIRDQHCVFAGCDRPPDWCDIHHLLSWLDELGLTDLANLVLLCRRHHILVHEAGWKPTRNLDGTITTHPPGHDPP
jgi:hypothetical protein